MIRRQTMLDVAGDSDARHIMCIKVPGGSRRRYAGVDDIIRTIIRGAVLHGKVKRGDVSETIVVHTKEGIHHPGGSVIRFGGNARVILNSNNEQPTGTCIFGPATCELHTGKFMKIVSLAPEILWGANHDS